MNIRRRAIVIFGSLGVLIGVCGLQNRLGSGQQDTAAQTSIAKRDHTVQDADQVKRPTLGVHVSRVPDSLRGHLQLQPGVGLIVEHVVEGSAADQVGLEVHDILHKLEDQLLINTDQLQTLIALHGVGKQVSLSIIRNGEPKVMTPVIQGKLEPKLNEFDAFHYFHGHPGMKQMQDCSVCHMGTTSEDDEHPYGPNLRKPKFPFDNFELFHGRPGGKEMQKCSDCHVQAVKKLNLPKN